MKPSGEAERRQVTVLFCDMVGSTALSGAVDPELLGELIRRYQNAAAGAIGRFGGFVAKFMGDGVLAYFGFPHAFEDAAERAVRAALAIVAEVGGIERPDGDAPSGADRHRHRLSSWSARSSAPAPRKNAPSSARPPISPRGFRRLRARHHPRQRVDPASARRTISISNPPANTI